LRELALEQRDRLAQAVAAREEAEKRLVEERYTHTIRLEEAESLAEERHAYAVRLESELMRKNVHIQRLEDLIHRLEQGRVMRLLRFLTGGK
jgi:hypothetical protein